MKQYGQYSYNPAPAREQAVQQQQPPVSQPVQVQKVADQFDMMAFTGAPKEEKKEEPSKDFFAFD